MKYLRHAVRGACALAIVGLLAACGGGGSGSTANNSNSGGNTQPQTVTGIATPDSVAVVTATNAN